jgi:carbamoylphosphate synthase large subunit
MPTRVLFGNHSLIFDSILLFLDRSVYDPVMGDPSEHDLDNFDFVVPLTMADRAALDRGESDGPVRAIIPSTEAVRLCHDKLAFNRMMMESGFGRYIPEVIECEEAKPPFILKRREDEFGFNSEVIRTEQDYIRAKERIDSDEFFKQTYIDGEIEHATHILMRKGEVAYQKTVRYEMKTGDYVKGHQTSHEDVSWLDGTPSVDIFAGMLRAAGFNNGTCCIDYKIVGESPKVFEINPRFGGSLPYDINRYLAAYASAL